MHSPCAARMATRTVKVGASATPTDGTTSAPLASTSDARRPMRSDSGPQNHAPTASAPMTTDTVSPVCEGATEKSRPSSGRIACVEYIAVNIAAAANRNGPIPPSPTRARARALVASATRSRLAGAGLAGGHAVGRDALLHGAADALGHAGHAAVDRPQLRAGQHDEPHRRQRDDAGHAAVAPQQPDLAEEVARAELGGVLAADLHLGGAGLDGEELVGQPALLREHRAGLDVDLVGVLRDHLLVVLAEPREERDQIG